MQMSWKPGRQKERERMALFSDFRRALTREILLTELLRIKAVIATASVLVACALTAYAVVPDRIERIWHGHFVLWAVLVSFVPFVLFELSVLRLLSQRLAQHRDVPYARRYV